MKLIYPFILKNVFLRARDVMTFFSLLALVPAQPLFAQSCSPISTLTCSQVQVNFPVNLSFEAAQTGTLSDKNGAGTGFTMADAYSGTRLTQDGTPSISSVRGYEPSRLTLSGGRLSLLTNAGIAFRTYNNQINTLGVSVNSRGKMQLETALVNPVYATTGVQGGLWLGLNDKTFIKLAVAANKVELRREIKDVSSTVTGTTNPDQRITGTISGLNTSTVRLRLLVDPVANSVAGFYSTDGVNYINVGAAYPTPVLSISGMGLTASRAYVGVFATHRNNTTPVTYHFEYFNATSLNVTPAFTSDSYDFQVSDAGAVGTVVGTAGASDGNGDPLQYSIISGNTNKAFSINAATGVITIAKTLNYHTQNAYALKVRVADPFGTADTANVNIVVTSGSTVAAFSTISWGTAARIPYGTTETHGVVVKGKLYLFGGYDTLKRPSWTPTRRSYVYDPVLNQWDSIAPLPYSPKGTNFGGATHFGLTTDETDIYMAGGYISNSTGTGQVFGTRQVWRYNVATNTYTALPSLPAELAAGQLQYLNGKIHYMGGANKSRADVAVHYALDLDNLSAGWKELAPLTVARNHAGSAVYAGKIYFIGGAKGQNDATVVQNTVERYDPETNTWVRMANMPTGRDHISSAVVVMGDRIIVLGGETSHNVRSKLVSAYAPASNSWSNFTSLPVARSAGVAAVLGNALHYIAGNFSAVNYKGVKSTSTTVSSPIMDSDDSVMSSGNAGALSMMVYPNPGNGQRIGVQVRQLVPGERIQVALFDFSGRMQESWTGSADHSGRFFSELVPSRTLRAGMYLVRVTGSTGQAQSKMIIK